MDNTSITNMDMMCYVAVTELNPNEVSHSYIVSCKNEEEGLAFMQSNTSEFKELNQILIK